MTLNCIRTNRKMLSIASKSPLREIARRQNPKSAAAARQIRQSLTCRRHSAWGRYLRSAMPSLMRFPCAGTRAQGQRGNPAGFADWLDVLPRQQRMQMNPASKRKGALSLKAPAA